VESCGAFSFPLTPPASTRLSGTDEVKPLPSVRTGGKIKTMQIETLNPHIHDFRKGEEHIARMQAQGLNTIFHSPLIGQNTKKQLLEYMRNDLRTVVENGIPAVPSTYPPLEGLDFKAFKELL
jgi:hypothetical protein